MSYLPDRLGWGLVSVHDQELSKAPTSVFESSRTSELGKAPPHVRKYFSKEPDIVKYYRTLALNVEDGWKQEIRAVKSASDFPQRGVLNFSRVCIRLPKWRRWGQAIREYEEWKKTRQ